MSLSRPTKKPPAPRRPIWSPNGILGFTLRGHLKLRIDTMMVAQLYDFMKLGEVRNGLRPTVVPKALEPRFSAKKN